MSDSSISSAGNERIAARLRLMAPGGRWEIFEQSIGSTDGLDAFCLVARSAPTEVAGFVHRGTKPHRIPQRLGDFVAQLLRERGLPGWLGAFCRPDSMVGSRICQTAVPGRKDHFYQVRGLATCGSRASDPFRNLLCSAGGLGHLPLIGATAASLATCVFAVVPALFLQPEWWKILMLSVAVVSSMVCVLLEGWSHRHYIAEDPREVVLDEVAGMALALAIVGPQPAAIAAAFFAFRFFDIFKPGIHWVERRGWRGTIVWDDLLAGLYAGGCVLVAGRLWPV